MSDQDSSLIRSILRGDLDAFSTLVRRHESAIANYIYWIVLNEQDAMDVAQEVFLKVYLSLDKYNPEFKFSTWLYAIAKNAAIDFLRRSNSCWMVELDAQTEDESRGESIQLADSKTISAEEVLFQKEMGKKVEAALNGLPLQYREVLVLRHLEDLSYEEISELLKLPLGTVKNRLFRAREFLKERLQVMFPVKVVD
jgi:RNA polymerase sigma-70 factor (ECF subfamily)